MTDTLIFLGLLILILIYFSKTNNKENTPVIHLENNQRKYITDNIIYNDIIDQQTTVLPTETPHDISFNNRDILEKHQENRLNSLIFG